MKKMKWELIVVLMVIDVLTPTANMEFKRVCYYTNWAQYRNGVGKFMPQNIDPFMCTHIVYAFAKIDDGTRTLKPYEWNDESTDWSKGMFERVLDMKNQNPSLKVLLAVGGWNHENKPRFTHLVQSNTTINAFADQVIQYIRDQRFDGFDLDWEYPGNRGSPEGDKKKFSFLCEILRNKFEDEARKTGNPRLLLTAAVAAGKSTVDAAYEIATIAQSLDFINLMAYDLHGSWEKTTGHNSPLYPRPGENNEEKRLNQDWAVKYWIDKGTPPEKLILGLATYGRSFTLSDSNNNGLGAAAKAAGRAGPQTAAAGFLSFYEICNNIINNGWRFEWDDDHKVPYATSGDQWVGFDDEQSIHIKSQYIVNRGLGGAMVWAIDLDDFNNQCQRGYYPLLNVIKDVLSAAELTVPVKPSSTTTAPPPSVKIQTTTRSSTNSKTTEPNPTSGATATMEFKRVCYYTNWAQYRNGVGKFMPEDIDPYLCTHIVYAFAKIDDATRTLKPYEWNDESTDWSEGMFERVLNMKNQNPSLKVLLAVGGWNHENKPRFTHVVQSNTTINAFADQVIQYLRDQRFDGFDLDWEYPGNRGSPEGDKKKFSFLCEIFRNKFEDEARKTGNPRLLLTAAVAAGKSTVDAAYEIATIAQSLDFINLMAYDLHGSWEKTTGHNSPLYPRPGENNEEKRLNQDWAVKYWIDKGTPPEKLILGLATYGRSFTLSDSNNNGLGAAAKAAGRAGPQTAAAGFLSFYEICNNIINKDWRLEWDDDHKVPYATSGDQWVGFDDEQSIYIKSQYIVNRGLGGAMVWAIDLDDFNNQCQHGYYPLLNVIKDVLSAAELTVPVKPSSTTTAPPPSVKIQTTTRSLTNSKTTEPNPTSGATATMEFKRVCYYTNWAQYRNGVGKFMPEDIDPHLCTHIVYAFGKIDDGTRTLKPYEWNDESTDWSEGMFERVLNMKNQNPSLKVLLAVGGWNHENKPRFTHLVQSNTTINAFADQVIQYLRDQRFDGFDLDWEYPGNRGSPEGDKKKFSFLCEILRNKFEDEARKTGNPRLLLTAAVAAGKSTVDAAYEIATIAKSLDFINLMAYDLHGSWEKTTGHNSPLYPRPGENNEEKRLNQDWAVKYWIQKGTPPEKLILGLATYGRSFTLSDSNNNGLGAAAKAAGRAGPQTAAAGFLSFYEICNNIINKGWRLEWDDDHKVPYATSGDQWVGFDDEQSIYIKSQYIVSRGLGGAMVWAIDLDDFSNQCQRGYYPLLNVIKDVLSAAELTVPVKPSSTTTAPPPSVEIQTTTRSSTNFKTTEPNPTSGETATMEFKRVCYYTNWAQYRNGVGKFMPEDIDPYLCTHIVYAFAKIDDATRTLKPYEWNDESTDWSEGMFKRVLNMKNQNPSLKVLLAVGGWNHENKPRFTHLVQSNTTINAFADQVIQYLRDQRFDGFDLDWEYPGNRGSPEGDKKKFSFLCEILRNKFEDEARKTGNPRLLLTAAVAAGKSTVDAAYEIATIAQSLDFINLMAYDLHGSWEKTTGHNSPLYPRPGENNEKKRLNQDWAVKYWIDKGTPPEKLILGLATYGRSFTLSDSNNNGLGAAAKAAGRAGPQTAAAGFLSFYEICNNIINKGWRFEWDDDHKVPYATSGDQWVGFDDEQSIYIKSQYIVSKGLGGAMVWAIDLDDFSNQCQRGYYPLLNVIKDVLSAAKLTVPVTSSSPTTVPQPPVEIQTTTKSSTTTKTTKPNPTSKESAAADFKRVCYYTSWSMYRRGNGKFMPEDIDPYLCTHLIYAFAKIENNVLQQYDENDYTLYKKVVAIKKVNPSLKVLLAVGGWNHENEPRFTTVVQSNTTIDAFTDQTTEFLRDNGFDGLDLDWEYPARRGSPAEDKQKFSYLCEILHNRFENEASDTGKPRLLLTAAIGVGRSLFRKSYEVPIIAKYLDFINLMTYAFHGTWKKTTGHKSPLYAKSDEFGAQTENNQDWVINYLLDQGVPKEKLILGQSTPGLSFTLSNPNQHGYGVIIEGKGQKGPQTRVAGMLSYSEICINLANGWSYVWNDEYKVPYAYFQDQWVGFEDERSFTIKTNYVVSKGLGGIMVWTIDLDDFNNQCGNENYPLLNTMKDILTSQQTELSSSSKLTTTRPTTSTTTATTRKSTTTTRPTTPTTTTTTKKSTTTTRPTTPTTMTATTMSTTTMTTTTVDPFEEIDPFEEEIDPFEEELDPFEEEIDPFEEELDPFEEEIEKLDTTTTSTTTTTTTTMAPVVCKPKPKKKCPKAWLASNCNCRIYYRCVNNFPRRGKVKLYKMRCHQGTLFSKELSRCVWKRDIKDKSCFT